MNAPPDDSRFEQALHPEPAPGADAAGTAPYGGFSDYAGWGAAPADAQPDESDRAVVGTELWADAAAYARAEDSADVGTGAGPAPVPSVPIPEPVPSVPVLLPPLPPAMIPTMIPTMPPPMMMPAMMPPAPPAEPTIFGPAPVPLHGLADPALDATQHPVVDAELRLAPAATIPDADADADAEAVATRAAVADVASSAVQAGDAAVTDPAAHPIRAWAETEPAAGAMASFSGGGDAPVGPLPAASAPPARRRRARRWRARLAWAAVIGTTLLLGVVLGWAFAPQPPGDTATGMPSMDPRPVPAVTGDLTATIDLTGSIIADPRVEVAAPARGTVSELAVGVGQNVAPGATLAQIVPPEPPTTRAPQTTKPPAVAPAAPSAPARTAGRVDSGALTVVFAGLRPARRSVDVTTPTGGVVKELRVANGDEVAAGDVIAVMQPTTARVVVPVKPAELYKLTTLPATLRVTIPNGPAPFDCGDVRLGDPGAPPGAPESVPVGASLSCRVPDGVKVFAGLDANVSAVVGQVKGAVLVPLSAVVGRAGKGTVTVVTPDGARVSRDVELGIDDGVRIQVVSGLRDGEVVLDMLPPPDATPAGGSGDGAGGGAGGGNYRDDGGS